jgi:phenylpyruvate tautomerase PptA (4-oxalocrotonate tautomerase family)
MPLIQVFTSARSPSPEAGAALLGDLSKLAAQRFGKPERLLELLLVCRRAF